MFPCLNALLLITTDEQQYNRKRVPEYPLKGSHTEDELERCDEKQILREVLSGVSITASRSGSATTKFTPTSNTHGR